MYKVISNWDTARQYFRKSLNIKLQLWGETHPSTQLSQRLLDEALAQSHQWEIDHNMCQRLPLLLCPHSVLWLVKCWLSPLEWLALTSGVVCSRLAGTPRNVGCRYVPDEGPGAWMDLGPAELDLSDSEMDPESPRFVKIP